MKYIVYLTVNNINNKYYVGVHKTNNPYTFDGYLGCGIYTTDKSKVNKAKTVFAKAIKKYGISNFTRYTIKIFDSELEALEFEKFIVDDEFIKNPNTYNTTLGGGYPPNLHKFIYQYSIEGDFIKQWTSISEVNIYYKLSKDRLRKAIKNKMSLLNYYWSEVKTNNLDITVYRPCSRGVVHVYDANKIYIKTFKSATEASEELNIPVSVISCALHERFCALNKYYFVREGYTINNNNIELKGIIYQYDSYGDLMNKFESFQEIKHVYTLNKKDLIRAINSGIKYANYYWSYNKYSNIIKENINIQKVQLIGQYDINGKLIKIWDSIQECEKYYPRVLQVLLGNTIHCKNYIFKYIS